MIHADHALARRLEALVSAEYRRLAEVARSVLPDRGADILEVAGGAALWLGPGSPVNQAVGLGMAGPVSEEEVERLEVFYHDCGAAAAAAVCQLADPSLLQALGRRRWRVEQFEHVLALELEQRPPVESEGGYTMGPGGASSLRAGHERNPDIVVRLCLGEERETWAHAAALGFSDGEPPKPAQEEFGAIMAAREEAALVLAWVDGRPAGTGALVIDGGVGWLSGDSTLPRYRRLGVQQAVQRYRLRLAREAGCDLAVTETSPGSPSQRNMERLGFRIVYTHAEFVKEL